MIQAGLSPAPGPGVGSGRSAPASGPPVQGVIPRVVVSFCLKESRNPHRPSPDKLITSLLRDGTDMLENQETSRSRSSTKASSRDRCLTVESNHFCVLKSRAAVLLNVYERAIRFDHADRALVGSMFKLLRRHFALGL